jgi:hypothetical protein
VLKRLDIAGQLPPHGWRRVAVIAALVVGGVVATGLTALIIVFVLTSLRS